MATSAANLQIILETVCSENKLSYDTVKAMLASKELLPKKLLAGAKPVKVVSVWASKQAETLAAENNIIHETIEGTGTNGKITIKDVKNLLQSPIKKVNASPPALKYARDNNLDISRIATGSGVGGKIVLKDVKDLTEPDPPADSDDELPPMSPAAKKLADTEGLDAEDLADIKGTGTNGKIGVKDIREYLKNLLGEETDEDDDE
jgi:pyruvate/2-oxoglutarate dehydrogenase complex dihydrolipoamide acyltransferase (E2) component